MEPATGGNGITRRALLKGIGASLLAATAAASAAACQQPTPAAPTAAPKPAEAPPKPAATAAPAAPAPTAVPKPAAAPTAAPAAVKAGGQASVAIFGAPGGIILPNFTPTNFSVMITQTAFETMLRYDSKIQFQPRLAEKWEVSPDGKVFTFFLRKDVKWSDGKPFTARDVEATAQAISHSKTPANWVSYVDQIVGAVERKKGQREDLPGVKVLDDYTIQATTSQPSATFLDLFGTEMLILPAHILAQFPMDQLAKSPFANQPDVTTGPYRLVRYVTDQWVELERNPNYWGKKGTLDKVFIKSMTPETAIIQLEKGELDVIPAEISGELPPMEAERLKKHPDVTVTAYPNINTETVGLNHKTVFGDKRVRQALAYAVDRAAIVKEVLMGYGKVAYSVYPEMSPFYLPDLNKYEYNPTTAKQLLDEAKWDSKRELNYLIPTGDTTREKVGLIVQQYLVAVGFNAQIERVDQATNVNRSQVQHKFDLNITQNRGFNNLDLSRRFHTSSYGAGVNHGGYSSPELDKAMEDARARVRFEDQKPLTDKIQRIINEDCPTLMVYYRDSIGAVNTKRLGGAVPQILGVHRTMVDWHLK